MLSPVSATGPVLVVNIRKGKRMTNLKFSCILAFLSVVLAIPATHPVNAMSAASVNDASRAMSSQSTVFAAVKKKRGRDVCRIMFKQCVAQCKKGDPANFGCVEICSTDEWWCNLCGGTPC
jgi:hypothetical protein